MNKNISVVKRDGTKELLDIGKIQRQVLNACDGIDFVSPSLIELRAHIQFYDGMKTSDIDEMLLRSMVSLINEEENPEEADVNYQYVAGRQRLSMLRKGVYGQYTPPSLYSIIKRTVDAGLYTKELIEWYSEEDWDTIELFVDHTRDEKLTFAAIEQLVDKYLVRNRVTGEMYETPQVRYAVAAATAFHAEGRRVRMKLVKEFYDCASQGMFTLATPVLAGLGTPTRQFSSCVLLSSGDSIDSIFASGEMMARYAAQRAGIGFEIGNVRGIGASIRGGELKHTGMIPFLKKWFADLRSVSQGGIRNSAATITYPIWHWQFDDLIVLKNNQGTEETRVRQLDYSVVTSKLFWRRFAEGGNITFLDPHECKELADLFYSDIDKFEEEYPKWEARKDIRKKVMPADEVFKSILKERTDTGRIYLMFIDNVQKQGPFKTKITPIRQSNLCQEIVLPTVPFEHIDDESGRIALCTLGSLNIGMFKNPTDLKKPATILVRALSNILRYQNYLSVHSKLHTEEFEPLGVGITNLAYWMAKRKYKYGSPEALADLKRWMEHMHYYLYDASANLAIERGPAWRWKDTHWVDGVFPWERRAVGVNELADFTPELDWEPLREKIKTTGIRNVTLSAIAPVESCQSWRNKLNFSDGSRMNFHDFLDTQGIDWSKIESDGTPNVVVPLNTPTKFSGRNGDELVESVVYNGFQPLNTIEFEDGTVMNFTDNHRFLVNRNGVETWVYCFELEENDELIGAKIKKILLHSHEDHTWDITTPSHSFLLPNGVVSHNSSVVLNSTNGGEMLMSLIAVKESKGGSIIQVAPEYKKLKKHYELMWEQSDCVEYLKTYAVMAAYIDQSISTNTFYNPAKFPERRIPQTLIAKNIMLAQKWGLKTLYYSLLNKVGAKTEDSAPAEEECESCKL